MYRSTCILATITALVMGVTSTARGESVSVMLEKAIYAEETSGDLDAAIKLYRQIVEDAKANRSDQARAHYRLGVCYLKKNQNQQAIQIFDEVMELYPDQTKLVEQAQDRLIQARGQISPTEVAKIVEDAVTSISTRTEHDPKVAKAVQSLEDLDEKVVVRELIKWLDSDKNTIRRSAIYILWMGSFDDIAEAVPALTKLLSHKEALTRGMAALALGGKQIRSSLKVITNMTLNDKDAYARRAAAYALGLLGDPAAKPALEKALKDDNAQVRNNAEAALTMLSKSLHAAEKGPKVIKTTPAVFVNDVDPSLNKITVTFDQAMMDDSYSWTGGGETFPKTIGKPRYDSSRKTCTLPVKLEPGKVYWVGINSPSHKYFQTPDRVPARPFVILFATKDADGKPTPIPEEMLANARAINAAVYASQQPGAAVVRTSPQVFENDVSPSLNKITVTFDRAMITDRYSWTGGGETFPKTTGKPRYDSSRKKCILPVKLEPGKVYWVGINSPSHQNFQTPDGIPAQSYVILFATKDADGKPTPIPEKMLAEAKAINAAATKPTVEPLKLDPAHWADGEVMRLDMKTMVGAPMGTIIYTADSAKAAGKDAWRIRSYMIISLTNMLQFTDVVAQGDLFVPVTGRTDNSSTGDFRAEYKTDRVELDAEMGGKKTKKSFDLKQTAYDNEQAVYLIRRMPLKEGYCASFPIFAVTSGQVVDCQVEVTGKEKVTVPLGTYVCYKVDLSVGQGGIHAFQHQLWFSADRFHYLVKYDSGEAIMELTEISKKAKGRPTRFQNPELGISITARTGWHFWRHPSNELPMLVQLFPPEMEAWALFASIDLGILMKDMTIRQIAEKDVEALKGFFEGYTVRADSWTDRKVAELPTARFVADYRQAGANMVEYRVYVLDDTQVHWFVFRIEKNQFDAIRPEFDAVADSLKPGAKKRKLAAEADRAKGWKLFLKGNHEEAEKFFQKAVDVDPSNSNTWQGLGWSQFNQGKPLAAKESFDKCLAIEPKNAAALNGLGWIAKGRGDTDEAIQQWKKAIEAFPDASAAISGLARTYMERKEYDQAVKYYQMWLKVEPGDADAKKGLERALAKQGSVPSESTKSTSANKETALREECNKAIEHGDLRSACEAEIGRVLHRKKTGNAYKDKIDLKGVYGDYVKQQKPSKQKKEQLLQQMEKYLAEKKGDEEYAWRINHLMCAIARDLDKQDKAAKYMDAALESYPETRYRDPAKHSKYQHLVNERAELVWLSDGVEAAERFALQQLKSNKKCDFFYSPWWEKAYKDKNETKRYLPLLRQIEKAYDMRAKAFPQKAGLYKRYGSRVQDEIASLEGVQAR